MHRRTAVSKLGLQAHLQNWGAASHVVRAGLAHSVYGRAAYGDAALLRHQSPHREALVDAVGGDAEALVGIFATLASATTLLDGFDRHIADPVTPPGCDPPGDRQRARGGDDANNAAPTFRIQVRARRGPGGAATPASLGDNLSRISQMHATPVYAVCRALMGAQAFRMLIWCMEPDVVTDLGLQGRLPPTRSRTGR